MDALHDHHQNGAGLLGRCRRRTRRRWDFLAFFGLVACVVVALPSLSSAAAPFLSGEGALTRMAASAVAGKSGLDVSGYRDYRGVRVLGTWVWSDALEMGLAAEIDEAEVLSTYRANRRVVVSVIGLAMLLMTLLSGGILLNAEQIRRKLKKARDDWEAVAEQRHDELLCCERKFRSIFDQIVQFMAIMDTSGRIMEVNQAALDITGSKPEEVLGCLFWDGPWWTHSEDLKGRVADAIRDAVSGSRVGFEVIHQDSRGRARYVDVTLMPVMDESGKVMFLLSMGNDMTDRKRAEEALSTRKQMELEIIAARDQAEEATRAKSHFLANMSHEVRTPMNAILGFLELALEGSALPGTTRQYLSTALSSARGLLGLINDILDISKLESGKLEIEEEPFHLASVMQQACEIMNVRAREKGIAMHLEIHPALSGSFRGDALRLKQILINLTGNAIKFTEEGAVVVSVKPEAEGRRLQFAVADTGIGIPEERLAQIFEPFSQADSSITRRFGGTGLGTTISSQLVKLMGGEIWVESREEEGSTFFFTIPLARVDRFEAEGGEEALSLGPSRCFRVLLVEDVEANVQLASIRLEGQGHEVSVAWNGEEAVDILGTEAFDLVLMDVQMPVMDGLAATRQIRGREAEAGGHIPIIAMTASVTKEEREEDLKAGMDAVVSKPIDFGFLFKVMEEVVPAGVGRPMRRQVVDEKEHGEHEYPSLEGVDVARGMDSWRNWDAFTEALLSFVSRYESVSEILRGHFDRGETEEAQHLVHTLKGVSGNLAMVDVFAITEEMNTLMNQGAHGEAGARLDALAGAFDTVVASIKGVGPLIRTEEGPTRELDIPELTRLFAEMCEALELYSPSAVEPCLNELRTYLTAGQIRPVQKELDRFDFDEAGVKTIALATSLGVQVEGADGDE